MRVGIICEGSTDFAVLEQLVVAVVGADQCVMLQPDFDRLRRREAAPGPGWQGVRKFLQTSAPALAIGALDLVVIHVDASIRNLDEIKKIKLPAPEDDGNELDPLCDHVKSWATGGLPDNAVVVLPREDLETWLLAAHTNLKDVESIDAPAEELAVRKLIERRRDGSVEKSPARYAELASPLLRLASDPKRRVRVAELDRFIGKLLAQKRSVTAGSAASP